MLGVWFGNFFEPFFSDREAVRRGMEELASLGFTAVNLDSKPWEDFFDRYQGKAASTYVGMQEYMMAEAARHGMDYTHLALYLCGDNLYPTIRDVPPVRGEESIRPDGRPMGTYKYWSPKAQQTMVDHVAGLLRLYSAGMHRDQDGRIVMQTMFEPIPRPSFDEEGRGHYLNWLENRYEGDLALLNRRYGLSATGFSSLKSGEYWLRPESLSWVDCARPSRHDFESRSGDFYRWLDNQSYLAEVLQGYLATMKKHWRRIAPELYIEPVLHQWGYFFNPPGQGMWQTGQRALDIYRCAEHLDGVLCICAPLNAENRADALALSVEGAILRAANGGRRFTGGLYLGRHVNGDIYRIVPPAEAIGTLVAQGAQALHVYGYSGLDDGGVMFRMDADFKDSLRRGNRWAREIIPLLNTPRAKEVAILFPAEMSLYEPLEVDEGGRHRMDLLGWFAQFVDLGWHVDVLHPDQVAAGALSGYRHLVVPCNSLYDLGSNSAVEGAVRSFVEQGGSLFHGPGCELARRAFGVVEEPVSFDCICWEEDLIPHGWSTVAFSTGKPLGHYIQSGLAGIAEMQVGRGKVHSFGFEYGYAFSRLTMPIVPPNYGRREMHPVVLLRRTPVETLVGACPEAPLSPRKGLEMARFGRHLVLVNHGPSPIRYEGLSPRKVLSQVPTADGWVAAHSALYLEL